MRSKLQWKDRRGALITVTGQNAGVVADVAAHGSEPLANHGRKGQRRRGRR